jgi:thiol:disulfide interchange protein/DsbC/DsbD-like thiol-disulfide interchange protein
VSPVDSTRLRFPTLLLALAAWLLFPAGAYAQTGGATSPDVGSVTASLLPAQTGVAPGNSLEVALRLDHGPGWSTFWRNPGGGEATRILWHLPEGWRADEIAWPAPEPVPGNDGAIFGHGYSDTIHLPVRIRAPAGARVGERARLKATISWLACRSENCIQGRASIEFDAPVIDNPAPVPSVRAALDRQVMPEWNEQWSISARKTGQEITFRLRSGETIRSPHFFPATEMIWYDAEQRFETNGRGELIGHLPLDAFYSGDATTLSGVLTFTDARNRRRAIAVRAPLGPVAPVIRDARSARTAGQQNSAPLFQILAFAFLGGLILNLMPCVLPILSMKALSLVKARREGATAFRADALAYSAGVLTTFLAFGALILVLRSSLGELGWGFQLQEPAVILALALLMTAVGFNLLGVFELGGSIQGLGNSLSRGRLLRASFFTGVLAVVVAAPCTAPFMASALGAALVLPPAGALGVFLALGLGLAFPYLLLSFLPGAQRLLPRPGGWMVTFRQILAFPMFATVVWLLWILGRQLGVGGMALGLVALWTLALGAWAFGRGKRVWKGFAAVCLLLTAAAVFGVARLRPADVQGMGASNAVLGEVAYTPGALDALLASGRPAFVYFTADWCITCKVNEAIAIQRSETAAFFEANNISVMVGDWTRQNPDITAILRDYGRAGVPMYLYYPPGAGRLDGILLPQILTVESLRNSIETARRGRPAVRRPPRTS